MYGPRQFSPRVINARLVTDLQHIFVSSSAGVQITAQSLYYTTVYNSITNNRNKYLITRQIVAK